VEEYFGAQVGDLVVEVVHSICQIEPLAARQTLKARTGSRVALAFLVELACGNFVLLLSKLCARGKTDHT
jgi:hypothetical protein